MKNNQKLYPDSKNNPKMYSDSKNRRIFHFLKYPIYSFFKL